MLSRLQIENFAIIDKLTVEFQSGLNVLTGETGAGKSILLDALNLIPGGRADYDCIRTRNLGARGSLLSGGRQALVGDAG